MIIKRSGFMEIEHGIYQLKIPIPDNPLGYLNCYLVEGTTGWLMVDTGWNAGEAFNALVEGLKGVGLTLKDISTIVVTHMHPDHFGLAGRIKQVSPGTKLMMHASDAGLTESRYVKFAELIQKMNTLLGKHGVPSLTRSEMDSASMPVLSFVTFTLPDTTLYGGEILSTGIYDLEVIWTPGHSPGHICLYEPKNGLLFSGDHILPKITSNISYHTQSGDNPLGDFLYSLNKVRYLPATKVLPAHENIFTDLQARIEGLMEHHKTREEEILRVIAKEPRDAYFITSQIPWNVLEGTWQNMSPFQKRAAVTEAIAHLECMKWKGTVYRIIEKGNFLYLAA
jgi:glyoxylase-like metal-dependent hydrolase (beta-lactamase superfamily II)